MESLFRDLRYGARLLWKDKGFTLTALLTLALCIGANTAVFTVVNSVLLRPLPVAESDRILLLYNSYPKAGVVRAVTSAGDYYDRLRELTVFEEQALYQLYQGAVVGVMPRDFFFLEPAVMLWRPLSFTPAQKARHHSNAWEMIARLKPGATPQQAQAQVDALNAANLERFPEMKTILLNAGFHTRVVGLHEEVVREVKDTLFLLWGGALFVLLDRGGERRQPDPRPLGGPLPGAGDAPRPGGDPPAGRASVVRGERAPHHERRFPRAVPGLRRCPSPRRAGAGQRSPPPRDRPRRRGGGLHPRDVAAGRPRGGNHTRGPRPARRPQRRSPRRGAHGEPRPDGAGLAQGAGGRPARLRARAADGGRAASRQLPAGAGGKARLRSQPARDRIPVPAPDPLSRGRRAALLHQPGPGADPRPARGGGGRRGRLSPLQRGAQRQRHPGRGLPDEAGRVAGLAEPGGGHPRLFRGHAHSPDRGPLLRRARWGRCAARGDRGRAPGPAVLA